jgi:hypothetical protein
MQISNLAHNHLCNSNNVLYTLKSITNSQMPCLLYTEEIIPFFLFFFYYFFEKIVLSARNENNLELLLKYTNKYTFLSLKRHMYYI